MTDQADELRGRIQTSIENARKNVGTRIEEIDKHLRASLDFKQKAADYAPQLCIGGLVTGVFLGLAGNRRLLKSMAIGLPLIIVARVAAEMMEDDESSDDETDAGGSDTSGS